MCDWLSWGVLSPKQQKELGLKSRIVALDDEMALALINDDGTLYSRSFTWYDVGGHGAIATYYRLDISDFKHCESDSTIPRSLVAQVNAGKMDQIQRSTFGHRKPYRYTTKGKLKEPKFNLGRAIEAVKAAFEEPLRDYCAARGTPGLFDGALARLLGAVHRTRCASITSLLYWQGTPQGQVFWSNFYDAYPMILNLVDL